LQQCKNVENRLRFDKVTEFKVGNFLRHRVEDRIAVKPKSADNYVGRSDSFSKV